MSCIDTCIDTGYVVPMTNAKATNARQALGQGARTIAEIKKHTKMTEEAIVNELEPMVVAGLVGERRGCYFPLADANGVRFSRLIG